MSKLHLIIIAIIAGILLYFGFATDAFRSKKVTDFESCVAYGNPIMESYPRQCAHEGTTYREEIADGNDLINIESPKEGDTIASPLSLSGEARGNWYFEASAPVEVWDSTGKVIGVGFVTAQGEWMTTEFVPFEGTITFTKPATAEGTVVFKKDNPSGLPENDASVMVPVKFSGATTAAKECRPTGCSGQICSDEDIASTCEFREEYQCYKTAECKRQASGQCGWTETPALLACLDANE